MRLAVIVFYLVTMNSFGQTVERLNFIQNKGQWNNDIDFEAQVPGGRVGVSPRGFSVILVDMDELERRHMASHGHTHINETFGHSHTDAVEGHFFQINLLGSNPFSIPSVDEPLDGHHNYFIGSDSCQWVSNALAFGSILYKDIYEGIDIRVSSVGLNLKYDFILRPGADPAQIKIEYSGVDGLALAGYDIEIRTGVGKLTDQKPYTWQGDGKRKKTIKSEYSLRDNVASFIFPAGYDECETLVIDPLLIFSTYSGSTADNWGSTATPGEHGTLYSAGVTNQVLGGFFPATVGAFQTSNRGSFDMAVIKFDSAGTKFLYATHLGGSNNDSPQSLVVDKVTGDLIVLGISSSPDYPTSANAFDKTFNFGSTIHNRVLNTDDQWDIVVTRLSPDGNILVGSTFLGGSGNDGLNLPKQSGGPLVVNYGDEMRGDVITDESGHVYVSSVTSSGNFPAMNSFDTSYNGGSSDGAVAKFTPDLSGIVWSGYVGGSGTDAAYSIKFDSDNNIVLAGGTTSTDFPVTPGAYQTVFNGIVDGWILRLASDGSTILNATFTGTNSFDQVYFVDLNASGNIFCYGQTAGQIPITSGVYRNANSGQFLQKFAPDLSTLEFSTVFGSGSTNGLVIPNISPTAFLVNDCDNIYMAGWGGFVNSSPSTGFWQSTTHGMPVTSDAHQKTTSGSDFYFIVLNGDATQLVYSTYLGGNSSKTHVDGGTSRFDKYGIVYHAVCSGCTFGNSSGGSTSDFPTTTNAKSRLNQSGNCNNAAFKFDLSSLRAIFDTNNLELTMPGFNDVCYPDSIVFQNFSTGGKGIFWDFDDGRTLTQTDTDPRSVIHQYQEAGQYRVKLKITDLSTCSQSDSTFKVINYFKDNIVVGTDALVCEGSGFYLTANGGTTYNWTSDDGTFTSAEQYPLVTPARTTSYYATVVDANGCSRTDTLTLGIIPLVRAAFQTYDLDFTRPGLNNVCHPDAILFKNQSVHGEEFIWNFDDGTEFARSKSDTTSIVHAFGQQGVYNVKLKAINPNTCNKADSVTKAIFYYRENIQVVDDGEICEGTSFQLEATGGSQYTWASEDNSFQASIPSPVVTPLQTTRYFVTVKDINNCVKKDTVDVNVIDSVQLKWQHRLIGDCVDRPSVMVQNLTPSSDDLTFQFDFGDGTTSQESEIEHSYKDDGTYLVKLVVQNQLCSYEQAVQLPVYRLLVPNVFTPDGSPGLNDEFQIAFGPDAIAPADLGVPIRLKVLDRWGNRVFESSDYRNDWRAPGLSGGVYYVHVQVGELATCKSWLHIIK